MFQYTVRMIMGNDTCTTQTTVEAQTASDAALAVQMKWSEITVRVLCVELLGDCCWDSVDCSMESHYCPTCETHLESDGECTNCDFA